MDILGSENINESLQTHFLIYKITNIANGKYYIGQHQTENPYDRYLGSGSLMRKALKKYDLSCFTKEILFDFDNFEDMNNKEKELVPLSACYPYNQMSYNIQEGGQQSHSPETIKKISNTLKGRNPWENMTQEEKYRRCEKISNTIKRKELSKGKNNPMYGIDVKTLMTANAIKEMRKKQSTALKIRWDKMSEQEKQEFLKKTIHNENVCHDVRKYMSEDKIQQWKKNIKKSTCGEKNPMYGKSSWEKCTKEEREARIQKFKNSMKGKMKNRKSLLNIQTNKIILVSKEAAEKLLASNLYVPYKNKRIFMVHHTLKHRVFILENEIQTYLDKGYVKGWKF